MSSHIRDGEFEFLMVLAELASQEEDPEKVLALVAEIQRLLDKKDNVAKDLIANERGNLGHLFDFFHNPFCHEGIMSEKPNATLPGTVEKIIKSPIPSVPEKAQIAVEGADDLYREIRIDNTLTNADGEEVSLKLGAQVEVTVRAEPDAMNSHSN